MSEQVRFLNMFSQYQPTAPLAELLDTATVVAADIDPQMRAIHAVLYADRYIPQRQLNTAGDEICSVYGLRKVGLTATHPADQITSIESDELLQLFVAENSMTRGSLAGAKWRWENETLHIDLPGNGKNVL